jgi:hypothetical protein
MTSIPTKSVQPAQQAEDEDGPWSWALTLAAGAYMMVTDPRGVWKELVLHLRRDPKTPSPHIKDSGRSSR